jgi:hypothetical protein
MNGDRFGDTDGPVAGFLGVMPWTYLGALALFYAREPVTSRRTR